MFGRRGVSGCVVMGVDLCGCGQFLIMASPSGGPGSNDEPPSDHVSLPEVPLYWTDFVWSLEKLRHRAYSRKMTEQ